MSKFVHLHIHSEYSLLDGANRIKDLPKYAKELGMDAMAITDHGVMYGVIDFYKECQKNGIKPILGCEVYTAPRTRFDKEQALDSDYGHLIILAKSNVGYQNLIKLVSIGFTEGFYYKPRIDLKVLEKYSQGLIVLSGCLAGDINKALLNNDLEKAKEIALWYKKVFKDDYYLEIQNNGVKEQVLANQRLIELAKELDIPLVATNDAHYLKKSDAYNHDILLCIQTGKKINDEDRMRFESDELYVKSTEEMIEYFKNIPEAIENTVKIANKCNVEIEFGVTKLPEFDVPKEFKTHEEYMRKLCKDGMKQRYADNPDKEILDRLEYELSVIEKMGYVDYYLIVWDFIAYAKSQGIAVGPGRGSGAGSIVAYAIGITDIDPIKYNLLFERFLNPERVSMPDFDIDFCYERRGEVINYVANKYGHDHVSQIITFGTMSARMVIRDVGRALDVPYAEADKLAKMIPFELQITIEKALKQNVELRNLYESDPDTKNLLDISMALEGLPRHASTHAAGVVITKDPVVDYVPLYVNDEAISTQFTMTTLEELGLLKMDFLGLRTLTVISDTIKLVKEHRKIDVKFDEEMNDKRVYKLWWEGKTAGIFQFESGGMTSFMRELKPDSLEDIVAGVSLYRPGPMDQIPRYVKAKNNSNNITYTHPRLEPILNVTYGCMVYQEQVMQIVRDLAGYSLARADIVRRAMGKKKLDVMSKEREVFINGQVDEVGNIEVTGCIRNGIDAKSADKIFDEMAEFAKYAFNKSHAAAYSVISYQTAFLKTYYKEEFMAATLNSYLGNLDKIPGYIDECKNMGIEILKPDINKSYTRFTVDNGKIRFGIGSVKNVGIGAVDAIVEERNKNGEYKSFTDFCERIQAETVNKKCIESLIKSGAFDKFNETRSTLMASFEAIIDTIGGIAKKSYEGQVTMFDLATKEEQENLEQMKYTYTTLKEFSSKELLSMEKDMLGLYISGHPLEPLKEEIVRKTNISTLDIQNIKEEVSMYGEMNKKDGQNVKIAGIINHVKKKYTKKNTIMAFVTIEDLYGQADIIAFEGCYMKAQSILVEDNVVLVNGRLSIKEDDISIVASEIIDFDGSENKVKKIDINITNIDEEKRTRLKGMIKFFTGDKNNSVLQITNSEQITKCGGIYITEEILEEFKELVGENNVNFE